VSLSGDLVYVADGTRGFRILFRQCGPISDAETSPSASGLPATLYAYPNPSSGRAVITFEVAERRPIHAGIYDAAGRRIFNLCDAVLDAGRHRLLWEGRDNQGRPVGGGVFWVRVSSAARAEAARILVIR
jgi:hypothetical protein